MLDPISDENAIFKNSWFKYFKLTNKKEIIKEDTGEKIPLGHTFMSVDGAVTEGKNDYSAIVVITTDHNKNMYVLETWREQVSPVNLLKKMIEVYFKWGCMHCIIQNIVLEKILQDFLKEKMRKEHFYMNIKVQKGLTTKTKEYRIKSLQPYYEAGTIYHTRNCGNLEDELLRFPKAKFDDLSDCLQMHPEFVLSSPKRKVSKDYDQNSLYIWKKRLGKLFEEKPFHLGQDNRKLIVNETFYG